MAENLANSTASSATQCRSNPVSGRNLPKTGVFQMSAGDYRLFRSENAQNRSPETGGQFGKARHWRAFLRVSGQFLRGPHWLAGVGGFEPAHGRSWPLSKSGDTLGTAEAGAGSVARSPVSPYVLTSGKELPFSRKNFPSFLETSRERTLTLPSSAPAQPAPYRCAELNLCVRHPNQW
jgi:hypothetical protein